VFLALFDNGPHINRLPFSCLKVLSISHDPKSLQTIFSTQISKDDDIDEVGLNEHFVIFMKRTESWKDLSMFSEEEAAKISQHFGLVGSAQQYMMIGNLETGVLSVLKTGLPERVCFLFLLSSVLSCFSGKLHVQKLEKRVLHYRTARKSEGADEPEIEIWWWYPYDCVEIDHRRATF
jgi:hypothetical protein